MKSATHVKGLLVLCGLATAGMAVWAQQGAPAPAAPAFKSEEYLLLGNANRGAGEPMVAVDPTDPRNIIAVSMSSVQQLHGKPATQGSTNEYHLVPRSTITEVAVTHDGGVTWDVKELPIMSGKAERCPDAFADVTKDGIFIAGCEPRETKSGPDFFGTSAFVISRDKGRTWGPMVQLISDYQLNRFAPGLNPVSGAFPKADPNRLATHSPWDRPFTHIDDTTGVIYAVAQGGSAIVSPTERRSQAYITASTDGGKTFGTIYAWDSPAYPQSSRGINATAGHGMVAVIYIASAAPASEGATCPCAVMGISKDNGKTFTHRVLKNITLAPNPTNPTNPTNPAPAGRGGRGGGGGGNGGLTDIAIDPTTPGRMALLKAEGARYSVSVSTDNGQTWSPFVAAGMAPESTGATKPAFEYSRSGTLGLIWRATYADRSYDIWAAISKDGGKTFSKSLRVSHAKSPAFDAYRNAGLFGDDIQDLSMDKDNIHLVWGDSRSGFQGVWYGRVKLADFEF